MRRIHTVLRVGAFFVGLGVLAACGATSPTNTVPPLATSTTAIATAGRAAGTTTVATSASPAGAAATPATTIATPATPAGSGTATRPVAPASPSPPGTPGTPGTPGAASVPQQAVRTLQGLANYRETWVFSGFSIAGVSAGDLTAVYDHNGGAVHGTLSSGSTQSLDSYLINNRIYVPNLVGGGYVDLDPTNPLATPAQTFFALPGTILTTIVPSNATYQAAGATTVNGQTATQYNGTIEIGNLGFINPSLQGQAGTAVVTLAISNDRGVPVMANITFRTAGASGQSVATARLDLSNIGQVGPITAPR